MGEPIWVHAIGDKMGKTTGDVVGYYDHRRRRVGERFQIQSEKHLSSRWMSRTTEKETREAEEEAQDTKADQRRRHPRQSGKAARPSDEARI